MKNIPLLKISQKGYDFFFFVEDPRKIIKEVNYPAKDSVQDYQRPWKETRVKAIAKYVAGDDTIINKGKDTSKKAIGLVPTSAIINVKNRIKVIQSNVNYYLSFPETSDECELCRGDIEIIDGQHRLIAFDEQYRSQKLKDDETYQMGFVVFNQMTEDVKKEIFIVTNDRVEKVDNTVLQNMMQLLGVLSQEDKYMFDLMTWLNREDISPLKTRINLDGRKLKNSIKSLQLQAVLRKSKTIEFLTERGITEIEKIGRIISNYLKAWEDVYNISFRNTKNVATLTKISGLRFLFNLFPTILDVVEKKHENCKSENISKILKEVQENEIFPLDYSAYKDSFRGDTSTVALAKSIAEEIKKQFIKDSRNNEFFNI